MRNKKRGVAQLVARSVRDAEVVGSIPVASTKTAVSPLVARLFLTLRFATGSEGGAVLREQNALPCSL